MKAEKLKEQIKNQLDHLPEEILKEAYDFLLFIEQKHKKETEPLKKFGLDLEAFEFWNDENETDYSIEDTKEYNEQQTAPVTLIVDIKKYSERTAGSA